jgi:hypothetical protein
MTTAMIGVTKKFAIIDNKFVHHMKNNIIGSTHNVAQIVGVIYSFKIFCPNCFVFFLIVFGSFLSNFGIYFSTKLEKNIIQIIAEKLSKNQTS